MRNNPSENLRSISEIMERSFEPIPGKEQEIVIQELTSDVKINNTAVTVHSCLLNPRFSRDVDYKFDGSISIGDLNIRKKSAPTVELRSVITKIEERENKYFVEVLWSKVNTHGALTGIIYDYYSPILESENAATLALDSSFYEGILVPESFHVPNSRAIIRANLDFHAKHAFYNLTNWTNPRKRQYLPPKDFLDKETSEKILPNFTNVARAVNFSTLKFLPIELRDIPLEEIILIR